MGDYGAPAVRYDICNKWYLVRLLVVSCGAETTPGLCRFIFSQVADTLSLLGLCTQRTGKNEEAADYIRKALGITEASEGTDTIEVGATLHPMLLLQLHLFSGVGTVLNHRDKFAPMTGQSGFGVNMGRESP